MTLHDAGLWFQIVGGAIGVLLVARVILPFIIESKQQREADERRAVEAEREMNREYY